MYCKLTYLCTNMNKKARLSKAEVRQNTSNSLKTQMCQPLCNT